MLFLFVSLACFAFFAAIFAATFAIDHFASIWEASAPGTWHGRFYSWASSNKKLDAVKGLSGLASALACLVFLVAMFYALMWPSAEDNRFLVYLTGGRNTSGGVALRRFAATGKELDRMPFFEYVDSHRIVKGRISSILPIGGGLSHVCVANGEFCGLADSSLDLKPGDTAYIRIGRPPSSQRRPPGWTITADEARALTATTKFRIEDK